MNNRIYWIDNLKGMLLLFVVFQHICIFYSVDDHINHFVKVYCAFHMAAFFVLSGYLYNPQRYTSFGKYLQSKWNSLLKPYLFLNLVFSFFDPKLWLEQYPHQPASMLRNTIFRCVDFPPYWSGFITHLFNNLLDIINGGSVFVVGPLWFLWVLCFCSLQFYVIERLLSSRPLFIIIITVISGFIGYMLYRSGITLPFSYHIILSATFCYGMGYILKPFIKKVESMNVAYQSIVMLAFLAIFVYGFVQNGAVNMVFNELGGGKFFDFVCGTIGGSVSFVFVSMLVLKRGIPLLSYTAQNSIVLLAVHFWVLYVLSYFVAELNVWLVMVIVCGLSYSATVLVNRYLYFLIGKKHRI